MARGLRALTPPYRIGREGSTDKVIVRLDRRGLYFSARLAAWRLRIAFGPVYARTFLLFNWIHAQRKFAHDEELRQRHIDQGRTA